MTYETCESSDVKRRRIWLNLIRSGLLNEWFGANQCLKQKKFNWAEIIYVSFNFYFLAFDQSHKSELMSVKEKFKKAFKISKIFEYINFSGL